MANTTLVPVDFHGTTLHAVTIDGKPYVSIRSVCDALSVDVQAQWRRIQRHPVLSQGVAITAAVPSAGGDQQTICLPLDMLNGWLFGINAARVRDPDRRERLVEYQRECFDVLARHFGQSSEVRRAVTERQTLAFKLATAAAAEVQCAVFDAVMDGRDDWRMDRWLLQLGWGSNDTVAYARAIDRDAFIASLKALALVIADPACMASNAELANLAAACTKRLAERAAAGERGLVTKGGLG